MWAHLWLGAVEENVPVTTPSFDSTVPPDQASGVRSAWGNAATRHTMAFWDDYARGNPATHYTVAARCLFLAARNIVSMGVRLVFYIPMINIPHIRQAIAH